MGVGQMLRFACAAMHGRLAYVEVITASTKPAYHAAMHATMHATMDDPMDYFAVIAVAGYCAAYRAAPCQ